ncbi:5'-methylthioadenosine/adenosylhomocysteine nucleosidase [Fructilactobacillus fructivorans]|uniref:adenosylhomocysteine nucleosidase n=1 Tax=Fructilactobacillus fructivorans TaxID=1614 RepID=A0AAE6TYD9_9LACO|nr:5'-methylthioadenosine/adenosylhomocysteine nucleosidase [Fructilactobacillus fructivorans]KRK58812.1 methylthioadenosine nucleosidase [Fructilactobacillus fructivorans]KRN13723.1 methylthioadenosine nucleosidase [Fructilactobacillus fructivorans]KRN39575.1 methylthioadenosine nucleosidase [Fructilactobacillus fructivorans]KRN43294.1 methylthioadenosine nucleosidase [Fructilactobacillus fructivorans]QFX92805.1 5'-methylthioadenosine/adenosylhomocysteine nucleosidase [Fructilactobacillus fru
MKTFGIICAMDEEIKSLKSALKDEKEKDINGIKFYDGTIDGQHVILVKSGIGKVEAGITAAILLENFNVDVLIHSGSAAGIGNGLSVGDLVISTQTAYHDVDATAAGYEYGQLPGQPARFDASNVWINKISDASKDTGINPKRGLIVTGDQFIAGQKMIDDILKNFPDALSAEMEGAAVGQVAHQFKIPYVVIRAMSDVGDEDANQSFDEFVVDAGKRSAQMLLNLFKNTEEA